MRLSDRFVVLSWLVLAIGSMVGQPLWASVTSESVMSGRVASMPDDYCAQGNPSRLMMVYTGRSCDASSRSLNASLVTCQGDPEDAARVYVIATNRGGPEASRARILFAGPVDLSEPFEIDAGMADEDLLFVNTYVRILGEDGVVLQSLSFNTSCAVPLSEGARFGGLELVGFTPAMGTTPGF